MTDTSISEGVWIQLTQKRDRGSVIKTVKMPMLYGLWLKSEAKRLSATGMYSCLEIRHEEDLVSLWAFKPASENGSV